MAEVQKDTIGSREDTLRFLDMVGLFSSQAMICLGKLANPMTGKAEKNLPAARLFIDTLEMLERKTRGNLTADEIKLLQASLTDLHLMYVEECKSSATETQSKPSEPFPQSAPAEKAESDESKVKFRKKYE